MRTIPKSILLAVASICLIFSLSRTAQAETIIDVPPFGGNSFPLDAATPTRGQPFTVPATNDLVLNSYSLYVSLLSLSGNPSPPPLTFRSYIYSWSDGRPVGPPLFQSSPMTVTNTEVEKVMFGTDRLLLSAGGQYVIIISVDGFAASDESRIDISTAQFLSYEPSFVPNDATAQWTETGWNSHTSRLPLAFQLTLSSVQDLVQELRDEIEQRDNQIHTLTQQLANLQQIFEELSGENQALRTQLADADQKIASLTAQVAQLQALLNQSQSAIAPLVNSIEADLRLTFKNPRFTIPGATPQQRLQNLIKALLSLNKGRKEGLYQGLGGKH